MSTEIQKIINIVTHTYEKNAWHGPSVKEVLSTLTASHAGLRVGTSHSIGELIRHMTTWRNFIIKKLEGDDSYDVSDADNFPAPGNWREAVQQLEKSQVKLIEMLEKTPDSLLDQRVPGREYKYFTMLHGIIHHDLYHLGQIVLIKKSQRNS